MKARELTPRDFGLRVRTHPEGFKIVAANKSKNATTYSGSVLYEGKLVECFVLSRDQDTQIKNFEALTEFIDLLQGEAKAGRSKGGYPSWRGVPLEHIYEFFRRFRGYPDDLLWGSRKPEEQTQIVKAIEDAKGTNHWDVLLVSGSDKIIQFNSGIEVKTTLRDSMKIDRDAIRLSNRRVATSQNLSNSLTVEDYELAESRFGPERWPSQLAALKYIEHPVLMMYVMTTSGATVERPSIDEMNPLVTVAVAFPKLDPVEAVQRAARAKKYLVNTVYIRNSNGYTDDGDDVLDDDDES